MTPQSEKSKRAFELKQANSARHPTSPFAGERLISRTELRHFVSASDMALWRWLQAKKFPPPIYIGARRYWKSSDIARWLESKQTDEAHHGTS